MTNKEKLVLQQHLIVQYLASIDALDLCIDGMIDRNNDVDLEKAYAPYLNDEDKKRLNFLMVLISWLSASHLFYDTELSPKLSAILCNMSNIGFDKLHGLSESKLTEIIQARPDIFD